MFHPLAKHPDLEKGKAKPLEDLSKEHDALAALAQELEQKLKATRANLITTARTYNQQHPIFNIPNEVWFHIFSYLSSRSRASAQSACVRFFQLCADPRLPAFPRDCTATPKSISLDGIFASSYKELELFNAPFSRQFVAAELIEESCDGSEEQSTYMIYLINSYTGAEEARFKIALPFIYISLITASDKNQLIFIGQGANNAIQFISYDLQSKHQEIIYQQSGCVDNRNYLRLSTGQFAMLYKKTRDYDNPIILRLLILKNASQQQAFIDVPLDLNHTLYLYEIKRGKYKNHLLIYNKNNFVIVNLKGEIKKRITIAEDNFPEYFSNYSDEIQEPVNNEMVFNCSSAFLHLNLITGKHNIIDLKPFLNNWSMRKFLSPDHILLVDYLSPNNKLMLGNCRTRTAREVVAFNDSEFPYDTLTLNNGNLVVKVKDNVSEKIRYVLYHFPEQQFIARPVEYNTGESAMRPEAPRSRP